MLKLIPSSDCSHAREALSARLDGELSELEGAGLDGHLRACAECSAFARELQALSLGLHAAALEQPRIEIFVPLRRRPLAGLRTAAAAAAIVAVAAGSAFAVGGLVGNHGRPGIAVTGIPGSDFLAVHTDSAEQHALAMARNLGPSEPLRVGGVIAV
jgi:predicted anti-sigma-YlaC factor YlaD